MDELKCLFCKKKTVINNTVLKRKIEDKIITLTNAPVHYCNTCKETFISKDAQDAINIIRDNKLYNKKVLFSFNDLIK